MIIFLDTSALVKFFHEEEGTAVVTGFMTADENEIWISELSKLEFASALYRRVRNNEINEESMLEALLAFEDEAASFNCEPLSQATVREAGSLLQRYGKSYGLRTLDALQLAAFSLIAEKDWSFVSADNTLCQVVKSLGYAAIDPLNTDQL